MNREEALAIVKEKLKPERYDHTIRVLETALRLGEKMGIDLKKVELSAIFHDYAKYRPKEEMGRWILSEKTLSKDLLQYHHELWHAPVGAILVEREVGILDKDILMAIKSHTTGRVNMSDLEKIIFLADYIEPGRSFPGVDTVREVAQDNINLGCKLALSNTIIFLLSKNQKIYPDTFLAYNDFVTGGK
ncbi:bis(5'-nucleosyl)-tetraphosphatase (symmetrical) YqeK [Bacillaceae bacterium S4-13-56]